VEPGRHARAAHGHAGSRINTPRHGFFAKKKEEKVLSRSNSPDLSAPARIFRAKLMLKNIMWPSKRDIKLFGCMNNYNLYSHCNRFPIWNPGYSWKIFHIFHSGMTRVSTSIRYVPSHSLKFPFFRWLRPEAVYLFASSVSCSWNVCLVSCVVVSWRSSLLTILAKVNADWLDVKTYRLCLVISMFVIYMKGETSISRTKFSTTTIVWFLFSGYPPMLEGRFMLYVLIYSIAKSLGILRHMIKSPSAVADI
jgi:hypothetical protein